PARKGARRGLEHRQGGRVRSCARGRAAGGQRNRHEPDADLDAPRSRGRRQRHRHPLLLPVRHRRLQSQPGILHERASSAGRGHRQRLRRRPRRSDRHGPGTGHRILRPRRCGKRKRRTGRRRSDGQHIHDVAKWQRHPSRRARMGARLAAGKGRLGNRSDRGVGRPGRGIMESSEDGSAVTYVADGPIEPEPEGNRSPEGTQVFSRRGSDAWSSKSIVTPNRKGEGFPAGKPQEYQLFSSDLTYGLVVPFAFENPMQEPPLVPGAVEEERGIYRRSNFTCDSEPATCYQPLITAENNTAHAEFGGVVGTGNLFGGGVLNGTANLDHIVFQSEVALTGPKPKPSEEVPRLYEWSAASPPVEQLKLVSVLPNGKPAKRPALGHALTVGSDVRNAISADGSRVFWTETEEGPSENIKSLYVRDTAKGETLKLNDPVGGVK